MHSGGDKAALFQRKEERTEIAKVRDGSNSPSNSDGNALNAGAYPKGIGCANTVRNGSWYNPSSTENGGAERESLSRYRAALFRGGEAYIPNGDWSNGSGYSDGDTENAGRCPSGSRGSWHTSSINTCAGSCTGICPASQCGADLPDGGRERAGSDFPFQTAGAECQEHSGRDKAALFQRKEERTEIAKVGDGANCPRDSDGDALNAGAYPKGIGWADTACICT